MPFSRGTIRIALGSQASRAWHDAGRYQEQRTIMEKRQSPENDRRNDRDPSKDIRKDYDPYERDPGAGKVDDERVDEASEQDARRREGVKMMGSERLDESSTSPVVHTGTTGQTARGSYGFNDATGQGAYMDRTRDGASDVGVDPVEQPSDRNDDNDLGENDDPGIERSDR
jgi:hypothetical protein